MSKSSILDDFKIDFPGVYRFIGFHQILEDSNYPLYVGKSGDTEKVWNYIRGGRKGNGPQMLKGRILRHLNDDAGVISTIIDKINYLKSLEYWIVNPNDYDQVDLFLDVVRYLEYYIRTNKKTYYDEIINVQIQEIKPSVDVEQIVKKIIKDKHVIEFSQLFSDEEREFLNYYSVITSTPIKNLINFRRYNTAKDLIDQFFESWKKITKDNYFWHKIS
ncbi:MAG: hypothetical protein ACFFBP_21105 [Promethearchaeota archaeon]